MTDKNGLWIVAVVAIVAIISMVFMTQSNNVVTYQPTTTEPLADVAPSQNIAGQAYTVQRGEWTCVYGSAMNIAFKWEGNRFISERSSDAC